MPARLELRTWLYAVLALAACLALAPRPAQAQGAGHAPDQGPHFVLRAYYLVDSFSHSESAQGVDSFVSVTYRGKPGGGVDAEYLFTPWVGIDVAASQTHIEATEVRKTFPGPSALRFTGKIQLRPFTVGLYGHFYRLEHLDLYIGPFVGVVEMTAGGFRPSDTEFGFGAVLGLDVPLGASGFALSGVARALASRFPDQLRPVSHFRDNYFFGGGLAYRW